MNYNLNSIFDRISETIESEYSLTEIGNHNGLKGTKRERILKNFFRDSLPQQYSIGDGEIFYSEGNHSNQVDVIIHSSHMPVFRYSRYLLFYPIESVFGVCEVKTKLDKARLEECIKNIQSVKKMKLPTPPIYSGTFHERPCGAVFAFDSIKPKTLKKHLLYLYNKLHVPVEERIDIICVLNKFIAIGDPISKGLEPRDGTTTLPDPLFLKTEKKSLMFFIPNMIHTFNKPLDQQFDFTKYIGDLTFDDI